MNLHFIGTGNACGIPVFGSRDPISEQARRDPTGRRRESCLRVSGRHSRIYLDAGPGDFRSIFATDPGCCVLLTHFHHDHVGGLLYLSYGVGDPIPVYAPSDPAGYGHLPDEPGILEFHFKPAFRPFECEEFLITPIPLNHGIPTQGYCVENADCRLAYLCDTCGLPESSIMFLTGWGPDVMILDCNDGPAKTGPQSHNNVAEALDIRARIRPRNTVLTHIGLSAETWLQGHADQLPTDTLIARDGLEMNFSRALGDRRISRFFA